MLDLSTFTLLTLSQLKQFNLHVKKGNWLLNCTCRNFIHPQFYERALILEAYESTLLRWKTNSLPKTHKERLVMRPILSAAETYNYALAKWLDEKLKPLSVNNHTISDVLQFAEEIPTSFPGRAPWERGWRDPRAGYLIYLPKNATTWKGSS